MPEWEIGFGEAFPLALGQITPETIVPGIIIYSPRAVPLAGWMSGLEIAALKVDTREHSIATNFRNWCER